MANDEEIGIRVSLKEVAKLAADAKRVRREIKGISDDVKGAGFAARSASGRFGMLGGVIGGLGGATLGLARRGLRTLTYGLGAGATAATIFGLKLAGSVEQSEIALSTMLGSQEAGLAKLKELQDFALKTPFDTMGIVNVGQRMLARGFGADELIPTLTAIGNATSALGTGQEGIDRISLALGQMRSSGRLNSRDMLQLVDANLNAWDYLAKAAGKSVEQVREDSEKGLIDGKQAAAVIIQSMENDPRFKGMMERQERSFLGQLAKLKDSVQLGASRAFRPLADALGAQMPAAAAWAERSMVKLEARIREGVVWFNRFRAQVSLLQGRGHGGLTGLVMALDDTTGSGGKLIGPFQAVSSVIGDLRVIMPAVVSAFGPLRDLISFAALHPDALAFVLRSMGVVFTTYQLASLVRGVSGAMWGLNAAVSANPWGATALAIGAVTTALIELDRQTGFFSNEDNNFRKGLGAITGQEGYGWKEGGWVAKGRKWSKDWLVDPFGRFVVDPAKRSAGEFYKAPGAAWGGTVATGGAVDVGERGRERLYLPSGAKIKPLAPGEGDHPFGGVNVFIGPITAMDLLDGDKVVEVVVAGVKDKLARL